MFACSQNMLAGLAILMTVNKGPEEFKERCINNDDGDDENGDNFDGDDAASGVQSGMQQSPFFFAHPAQNFLPRWWSKNKESPYWNWPATTVFHNFTCKSRVSAIEVGTKSFLLQPGDTSQPDDSQKVALCPALSFRQGFMGDV